MVEVLAPGTIRGPLRYALETSSPQVEAGKEFSVTIQITNPYDVPVTIYHVGTTLPVEFAPRTAGVLVSFFKRLFSRSVTDVKVLGVNVSLSSPQTEDGEIKLDEPVILQPGNSTVKLFTVRTQAVIFFQPATYNLHLSINYEIDGNRNEDSTPFKLNIRAPLKAIIYGSLAGSIIGYVLRSLYEHAGAAIVFSDAQKNITWLTGLFGNLLLSVIVIVAFARKKDAQPILSIEDFWGGFFVGFLAGYTGKSFLDKILGKT